MAQYGYALIWSPVLEDLVAIYETDEDLAEVPPAFTPYSLAELAMFDEDNGDWNPDTLRSLHFLKKSGAIIKGASRDDGETAG